MNHPRVREILESDTVFDASGRGYPLVSGITPDEGQFIWDLITRRPIERTLEVGCAYGVSTLYICDALSAKGSPHHRMIDPNQSTQYHGIGVRNLEQVGFDFYELIERPSEIVLPELAQGGERSLDFAFVDGHHTFDQVILEFYYLDRMLDVGGVIVFDDVTIFPGVGKAVRYVAACPGYEVCGTVTVPAFWKRTLVDATKRLLGRILRLFPASLARELFNDSLLSPGDSFGVNTRMVAVEKTGPGKRESGWYLPF